MQFGWLTLSLSPSPEEDAARIDQQLAQACYAETVGFDDVWLTEHYFTGESVYNDPLIFASALAVRTTRVRIGFAVLQMALHHPVRLAVQLSLLDNLSKGRLDVGIGRGTIYNEYEFVGYGLRSDDSRPRMAEAIDILTRAWTEAPCSYAGTYYQFHLPELRPRPFQRPYPPLWRSVVSPASFTDCGRLGVPILASRISLENIAERWKLYEEGLEAGGHNPETRRERLQQAAVWRNVHVADSDARAVEAVRKPEGGRPVGEGAGAVVQVEGGRRAGVGRRIPGGRVDEEEVLVAVPVDVEEGGARAHRFRQQRLAGRAVDVDETVPVVSVVVSVSHGVLLVCSSHSE